MDRRRDKELLVSEGLQPHNDSFATHVGLHPFLPTFPPVTRTPIATKGDRHATRPVVVDGDLTSSDTLCHPQRSRNIAAVDSGI